MLKLVINLCVLILSTSYAAATTCHDLQQSQLLSLNERMNQMIDTISALLPTPLKKPTPLITPALAPSPDFKPAPLGYESTYYTPPPAYKSPAPTPYVMYFSPPQASPTAIAITPPRQPNPISPPRTFSQIADFLPEYAYPPSNVARRTRSQYQYENPVIQYQNTIPTAPSPPPSYPSLPYPFTQPYSANYNQYSPEYAYAIRPQIPMYPPGQTPLPFPVYTPPNPFVPTYPTQPERLHSLYT